MFTWDQSSSEMGGLGNKRGTQTLRKGRQAEGYLRAPWTVGEQSQLIHTGVRGGVRGEAEEPRAGVVGGAASRGQGPCDLRSGREEMTFNISAGWEGNVSARDKTSMELNGSMIQLSPSVHR